MLHAAAGQKRTVQIVGRTFVQRKWKTKSCTQGSASSRDLCERLQCVLCVRRPMLSASLSLCVSRARSLSLCLARALSLPPCVRLRRSVPARLCIWRTAHRSLRVLTRRLLSAALLLIVVVACRADLSERCARLRLHSQTVLEDVFSDAPGVRASMTCTKRTYVCVVTADDQRPLYARELEL